MHFHLPKPLRGWREFFGEVGVIVLGVLIALTAQQIVETLHWRGEVRDFRAAIRSEMSIDLGTYVYHEAEGRCLNRRLDELQYWLDSARAGHPFKLTGPIGTPNSLVIDDNVWQSRDADTVAHMSLQEKLEYGHLYNEFANNEVHRLDERAAWIELGDFDGASALDHQDQRRLQGLISRARLRDMKMRTNAERFTRRAAQMGIFPRAAPDWPSHATQLCRPVLPAR